MPKTSIMVKLRRSSCLYPSFAESIVRHASSHYVGVCPYPVQRHHPRWPGCSWALMPLKLSAPRLEPPYCKCIDIQGKARNASRKEETRWGKDISRRLPPPPPMVKILRHPTWRSVTLLQRRCKDGGLGLETDSRPDPKRLEGKITVDKHITLMQCQRRSCETSRLCTVLSAR